MIATAKVHVPEQLELALRGNAALTQVVAFEQGSEIERGLLGVATDVSPLDQQQLQLLSFPNNTVTARGMLVGASRRAAPRASGVVATGVDAALLTFDLDGTTRGKIYLPPVE